MRIKMLINIGLINVIICSVSYGLPPSLITLNNIADMVNYRIGVDDIYLDGNNNLVGYFTNYDSVLVMNIYRFQINIDGEIIEVPHVIYSVMGRYDDFKVRGEKTGRSHLLVGIFGDTSCDWDAYYTVDSSGKYVAEIASLPPGDLSCSNIISDSIFIAARIGDMLGCWREIDDYYGEQYFQVFRRAPRDTNTNLINLPIVNPGFYPTALEITSENKILVIADDSWRTRYNYYGKTKAEIFSSFIVDLNDKTIINSDSGNIVDRANYIIPNFNKSIFIYGPSTIWMGDSLLYYFRMTPLDYYKDNVSDKLCILIFDKNGNNLKTDKGNIAKIIYKNINVFGRTEKIIPWIEKSGSKITKVKFGVISFKDFPNIYIDPGDK